MEEAVLFAVENRDESVEALAQGEKRLEELQSQEKSPFAGPADDMATELFRFRAQVADLPLSVWMEDRQNDLEARDDPTGTFRRRAPVSHSSWRRAVRTLLMGIVAHVLVKLHILAQVVD